MTNTGVGTAPLYPEPSDRLRIAVARNLCTDGYEFYFMLRPRTGEGKTQRINVTSFEIREVGEAERVSPAFVLTDELTQALMNELWDAGVRPRDVGGPGELSALRAHLADMRAIVALKIGVPLKDTGIKVVGR